MSHVPEFRLAVLGSPIAHSKSPALHAAAYGVLGLDWDYDAIEVTGDTLADFVDSRDSSWRGLSLTMPLKRDVLPLLDRTDPLATLTGSANTVLFRGKGAKRYLHGFNTDVFGITRAVEQRGRSGIRVVQVLGGGATAASAIVAAQLLGAERVYVSVRTPDRAMDLVALGERAGVEVRIGTLDAAGSVADLPDLIISTLPNGADVSVAFSEHTMRSSLLFDVAYHPWPTTLGTAWQAVGGEVIGGLDMLVLQALIQVRIFVNGSAEQLVPREAAVLAAMYATVGL